MKNLKELLLLLLLIYFGFVRCLVAEELPLKVGVSIPLSGNHASYGNSLRDGMRLAKEDWDKDNKVDFIFEDDGFSAKNAVANVNKFLAVDKVNAAYIFGSTTALAVIPLIERNKMPTITAATAKEVYDGRSFVMNMWLSVDLENAAVVKEVKRRSYKTCALVATQQDGMLALQKAFINSGACHLKFIETFVPDELDFKSVIVRIKQENVDAVYILLLSPQMGTFAKQLRQLGYQRDIFLAHQAEDIEEVKIADGTLAGAWFSSNDLMTTNDLAERVSARYGYQPMYLVGYGYDAAKMFIQGAKENNLNGYLHHLSDFDGALGKINADADGYFRFSQVGIKIITRDGFSKLGR